MREWTNPLSFKPWYLMSTWTEPGTTTKRITVAIVLPSGVGKGDFSVRATEDGKWVELTVVWPNPLIDLDTLHRKWLWQSSGLSQAVRAGERFERYHSKCVGFEASLKELQDRVSETIESVARISLPFPVQTRIDSKSNLG